MLASKNRTCNATVLIPTACVGGTIFGIWLGTL